MSIISTRHPKRSPGGSHNRSASPLPAFDAARSSRPVLVVTALIGVTLPFSYGMVGQTRRVWVLCVLVAVLMLMLTNRGSVARGNGPWFAAAALALLAACTGAFSTVNLEEHLQVVLYLVVLWGPVPLVCKGLARDRTLVQTVAAWFVVGQTFSSLVGLYQSATGGRVLGYGTEFGRATGLAGHQNILGLMCAIALLVLVAFFFCSTGPWRLVAALAGVANLTALLASGSLTATVSLLLGLFVIFWINRVRLSVLIGILLFFAAVGFSSSTFSTELGFESTSDRIAQTTGQTDQVSTVEQRASLAEFAWRGIQRDPLMGVGLDDESGSTIAESKVTHNIFLRSWFQGGLAMLVAMLVLFFSLVALVLESVSKSVASGGTSAIILCMLAFSLTSAALQQPYFWLVVVFCWAVSRRELDDVVGQQKPANQGVRHRRRWPVAVATRKGKAS